MSVRKFFILLLVVAFLGFCVYSYNVRTNYNVDKQDAQIEHLNMQLAVAGYALSLFPASEKNEVFFNSIENEYPDFKEDKSICDLIGYPYEESEEEENITVNGVIDCISNDFFSNKESTEGN